MRERWLRCFPISAGLAPRCTTQVRFPLGLPQWDHNWLATCDLHKSRALPRACPGGSRDSDATLAAKVAASPGDKPGGERKIVTIEMKFMALSVACQLSFRRDKPSGSGREAICRASNTEIILPMILTRPAAATNVAPASRRSHIHARRTLILSSNTLSARATGFCRRCIFSTSSIRYAIKNHDRSRPPSYPLRGWARRATIRGRAKPFLVFGA